MRCLGGNESEGTPSDNGKFRNVVLYDVVRQGGGGRYAVPLFGHHERGNHTTGTGGPYELLNEDTKWAILGRSAVAGIYPHRESFMRDVIPLQWEHGTAAQADDQTLFTTGDGSL